MVMQMRRATVHNPLTIVLYMYRPEALIIQFISLVYTHGVLHSTPSNRGVQPVTFLRSPRRVSAIIYISIVYASSIWFIVVLIRFSVDFLAMSTSQTMRCRSEAEHIIHHTILLSIFNRMSLISIIPIILHNQVGFDTCLFFQNFL